jgi:hypothetical protein
MLSESNLDIEKLLQHLERKVKELKRVDPKNELLPELQNFYQGTIASWMEKYPMMKKEVDPIYDGEMKNIILDWIIEINKFLKK